MLGWAAEAEDAAQDAFVEAWRSLPRFRGTSSSGTWLHRITTNRCPTIIAARHPTDPLDDARAGDRSGDPAARAEQREELPAIAAGLAGFR